jgi:DNA polymerase I-like protein with 3'-5' exonuclease and polymerase domains
MLSSNITTLDFETEGIEGDPLLYPPKPVGLAVRWHHGKTEYITDWDTMIIAFARAVEAGPVLFHNASFDLSVARHWFGIEWPHWSKIHDTMYLVYLNDPYARSYGLKPSAERYLNLPPEEQDACEAWIRANIPNVGKDWGKFLCKVPVDILSPYAIGDVQRTYDLYEALAPDTPTEPYDRERELMPTLVRATRTGVRCATGPLSNALEQALDAFGAVDNMLRQALQAPALNPGSSGQLADALDAMGLVDEWVRTPTGARSCDMKNLRVKDPAIMDMLKYRSTSKTLIGTFMQPWLEMADGNGRLHPSWNSTRGDRAGGTRTGRLSSARPNFQNIPNPAGINTPPGLPDLPRLRDFILPEEGHVWLKRDFSAQEIRVMAHFEDGALAEAFRQDPDLDPHELVREEILKVTGHNYPRKYVKETGFGILYGMGRYTLAERLDIRSNEAWDLMLAYKKAIPGVQRLQDGTKRRGRADMPIKTWGGRLIHKEPARIVKGEMRSFEYKLLNYLIQGSSADQTKQCIIDWSSHLDCGEVFMATVHDEINISAPEELADEAMEHLRICMDETCEFDVPMRSEGFVGPSWGEVGDE